MTLVVSALALALFALHGAAFAAMWSGCFFLRRAGTANSRSRDAVLVKSPLVPAISILAAVRGAAAESLRFVRSLVDLEYSKREVVAALDGPSAADLAAWIAEFGLSPCARAVAPAIAGIRGMYESRGPARLVVVDKEPGGPDDALNAALNAASSPLIALFDPDSEIEPSALARLAAAMLEEGAGIMVVSGPSPAPPGLGLAGLMGALGSLRVRLGRAAAFAAWKRPAPVPGGALMMARDVASAAGGFRGGALGLALRIRRRTEAARLPFRVVFTREPISHPRPERTFADLRRGALGEQRELACALREGRSRPLPQLWCMQVARPALETAAYLLAAAGLPLGWMDATLAGVILLATVGLGIGSSMAAVALTALSGDESIPPGRLAALFFAAIPENLGYRQIRNLWLIEGFLLAR
jgi:hypothetical protein